MEQGPQVSSDWYLSGDILFRLGQHTPVIEDGIPKTALAAFDLYGTLIQSDRGKYFPQGDTDWTYTFEIIPAYLRKLKEDGWCVAIFSNLKGKPVLSHTTRAVEKMMAETGINPFVFLSHSQTTGKPNLTMWQLFTSYYQSQFTPISFFCGDKDGPIAQDVLYQQGDSDRKFAENIGLKFYNPGQLFGPVRIPAITGRFLAIMVGQPGSGKSTFVAEFVKSYPGTVVLERSARLLTLIKQTLARANVIVDATNPSRENRAELIRIATGLGIPSYILWNPRPGRPGNLAREKRVPEVVMHTYSSRFEPPSDAEGAAVFRIF